MQKTESKTIWTRPPILLGLISHQIDVWRISLNLPSATVKLLESILSANETQRAAGFHLPANRDRYIVAHGGLRDLLARYLHCEPSQLNFSTNDYGKPALVGYQLEFNLSHSENIALIAVSRERKVGVDVECIRSDMEHESIARRFFSPYEFSELKTLPPEQREVAFFNWWTRKEAYIKAQGLGLSLPLDSFDVSITPNEPAFLRATRTDSQEAASWTLFSLEVHDGYAAAAAVEGQNLEFRLWDWNATIR